MGSFVELTLAFTFAADTPVEILGAFSEWQLGSGPALPALEDSLGEDSFDAQKHLGSWFGNEDPMSQLSPLQSAAMWRYLMGWPDCAYFPGTPSTVLRWDEYGELWTFTTRTLPKEPAQWVQSIIAPLGRWATEGSPEYPRFVGYILDEYNPRPVLIWSVGGTAFKFEGEFL